MKWAAGIIAGLLLMTHIAIAQSAATTRPSETATRSPATRPAVAASEIHFDGTPFADAIESLRDLSKANIVVNWSRLEAQGIDRNTPITLRVRNVRFGKLLQLVLDQVDPRLRYTADQGIITVYVSEYPAHAAGVITKVFDATDLMFAVPEFQDLLIGPGSNRNDERGTAGNGRSGSSRDSGRSNTSGRY